MRRVVDVEQMLENMFDIKQDERLQLAKHMLETYLNDDSNENIKKALALLDLLMEVV